MSTFIEQVGAAARKDMKSSRILASLTIAQAILESANGTSGLATKGKNLFGIKAGGSWKGESVTMQTTEYVNGKAIKVDASFRKYESYEDSIADHTKLLTTASRYANLIGVTDYKRAALLIRKDGYATDPAYTDKLIAVIEQYDLTKYDSEEKDAPSPMLANAWAWGIKQKLIDGTRPQDYVTREELIAILSRLEGENND